MTSVVHHVLHAQLASLLVMPLVTQLVRIVLLEHSQQLLVTLVHLVLLENSVWLDKHTAQPAKPVHTRRLPQIASPALQTNGMTRTVVLRVQPALLATFPIPPAHLVFHVSLEHPPVVQVLLFAPTVDQGNSQKIMVTLAPLVWRTRTALGAPIQVVPLVVVNCTVLLVNHFAPPVLLVNFQKTSTTNVILVQWATSAMIPEVPRVQHVQLASPPVPLAARHARTVDQETSQKMMVTLAHLVPPTPSALAQLTLPVETARVATLAWLDCHSAPLVWKAHTLSL